jgi:hypothetical protein
MLYSKMAGKSNMHEPIWVNRQLCFELGWVAENIETSTGIHMLSSVEWTVDDADMVLYTDTCLYGLGIWLPHDNVGLQHLMVDPPPRPIFYYEALTVVAALHRALTLTVPPLNRVVVYCDNTNTVDMFNTLHAQPEYNSLLLTAAQYALQTGSSFRVFHIPGDQNTVSDALSRHRNFIAYEAAPGILIQPFEPPQLVSGAAGL